MEESHENKLTYRQFLSKEGIKKGSNGLVNFVESKHVIRRGYDQYFQILEVLNEDIRDLIKSSTGQTSQACNSMVKAAFMNYLDGEKFSGIVLYLPLGKVLRNTETSNIAEAISFIEKYIKLLISTKIFFGIKCIGEVEKPSSDYIDKSIVSENVNKSSVIRKKRIIKLISKIAEQRLPNISGETDIDLEKRWIGISIEFGKKIKSQHHALAHVTAIRYLFYNRYKNIAKAFIEICEESPKQNIVQSLSLAHYFCPADPYSSYYGLMNEHYLMSFPDDYKSILSSFKKGSPINQSFSKFSPKVNTVNKNSMGMNYEHHDYVKSKKIYEENMRKLCKNKEYKEAYKCINSWVNGDN